MYYVANDITKVNNRRVDQNAERDCHQPANSDFSANVTPKVHGEYVTQIFENKETGYCIFLYKTKEKGRLTCVGYNLPKEKNATYTLYGTFRESEKYTNWQKVLEATFMSCQLWKVKCLSYLPI